ncbi:MAG: hypothetical protein M1814_000265 [Vezdaea aestivalis]|nr:MAG: hypothetical protein M1814_000265 [Vezdaea aestivalis]
MFTSLPDLTPRDSHLLWYTPSSGSPLSHPSRPLPPHHSSQFPHHRPPISTPLMALHQSENNLQTRLHNIQHFGSTWLRPAGVGKTFQAAIDEQAEREELSEGRAREARLVAEAEAAEAAAEGEVEGDVQLEVGAGEGAEEEWVDEEGDGGLPEEDEEELGMGVDLDGDVPEAEDGGLMGSGGSSDEEDDDESE